MLTVDFKTQRSSAQLAHRVRRLLETARAGGGWHKG